MRPKLLVLMYHRISDTTRPGSIEHFRSHIEQLASQWPIVTPGEPLTGPINVCLTFDDAYFDFYHYVFPLLEKLKLKAVLGVPTAFIPEKTEASSQTRLSVPYPAALEPPFHRDKGPLCTWSELKEMASSGYVQLASHSQTHCHLARDECNLADELVASKALIEAQCGQTVNTFIYPFGNLSRSLAKQVAKHYPYSMRIGGAINHSWSSLLYRVDADAFWPSNLPIQTKDLVRYTRRYWFNRLRGK